QNCVHVDLLIVLSTWCGRACAGLLSILFNISQCRSMSSAIFHKVGCFVAGCTSQCTPPRSDKGLAIGNWALQCPNRSSPIHNTLLGNAAGSQLRPATSDRCHVESPCYTDSHKPWHDLLPSNLWPVARNRAQPRCAFCGGYCWRLSNYRCWRSSWPFWSC